MKNYKTTLAGNKIQKASYRQLNFTSFIIPKFNNRKLFNFNIVNIDIGLTFY